MFRREGDDYWPSYQLVASHASSQDYIQYMRGRPIIPEGPRWWAARRWRAVPFILPTAWPIWTDDWPELQKRGNYRSLLGVPVLRGGELIGVLALTRSAVRPFSEKQILLIETFADQAVIAIENARLFEEVQARTRELTESLEYQTATSEVLGVISRSPTDAKPVFESIAISAAQLCGAQHCNVYRFDGRLIYIAATYLRLECRPKRATTRQPPIAPGRGNAAARSIAYGTIAEIPDIDADADYERRDVTRISNLRSTMAVPMLKDGRPIGSIVVSRSKRDASPTGKSNCSKPSATKP